MKDVLRTAVILFALSVAIWLYQSVDFSFASHGGPTQHVEGIHDEGDGGLSRPVLIGGDDGTDITNILVDTDGHPQIDVLTMPTVTVDLGSNNDVVATAGSLFGNSPTVLEGTTLLFNAGDITATNFGASTAVTVSGTGTITQVCLAWTMGTLDPLQTHSVFFFDADPVLAENVADLTAAEALMVIGKVDFVAADYPAEFATAETACQSTTIKFTAVTHAALHVTGAGALTDEIANMRFWYRRDS